MNNQVIITESIKYDGTNAKQVIRFVRKPREGFDVYSAKVSLDGEITVESYVRIKGTNRLNKTDVCAVPGMWFIMATIGNNQMKKEDRVFMVLSADSNNYGDRLQLLERIAAGELT